MITQLFRYIREQGRIVLKLKVGLLITNTRLV